MSAAPSGQTPLSPGNSGCHALRYAQLRGYDIPRGGMSIREFSDYQSVSGYAMAWAVNTGVMGGYGDKTLQPQNNATRAMAARMLKNFLMDI